MPDSQPPPEYRSAAEVLDRARALFGRANQELERGIGVTVDDDHMSSLYRAQTFALVGRFGAELAEAMMVAEDAEEDAINAALTLGEEPTEAQYESAAAALRARANRDSGDAG